MFNGKLGMVIAMLFAACPDWLQAAPPDGTDPVLLQKLEASDQKTRLEALIVLKEQETVSAGYADALVKIIKGEPKDKGGDAAAFNLVENLNANLVLVKIGKPAVPGLRALMKGDEKCRWRAVETLERMGKDSEDALPELIDALSDKNESIRYFAAKAMCHLGTKAKAALPALMKTMNDPADSPRQFSLQALAEMGPEAKAALPGLKKLLKHKDSLTQMYAEEAIEKIEGK